jgi:hypothetical protein
MKRYECIIGRRLNENETSSTGIYAIRSTLNGSILRAPIIKGIADMYRDETRDVHEARLMPI